MSADRCDECVIVAASRRAFLRQVGLAAVGAIALAAGAVPAAALAESVTEIRPARLTGSERVYDIPPGDSISVDTADDVIVARWENRVYAFSLKCPHRGARLEWRAGEGRLFCPKHKARFRTDGAHDSGRRSRDLDRYDISRSSGTLVVHVDALRRADRDAEAWRAAVIVLA